MTGWRRDRAGFTLLELLIVMAIMMIMISIAIGSFWGVSSGYALKSSVGHLRNTLMLARQTAIMQGRGTYVFFGQDATNSWYSIVVHGGTGNGSGTFLSDDTQMWDGFVSNTPLFRLDGTSSDPSGFEVSPVIRIVAHTVETAEGIWGSGGSAKQITFENSTYYRNKYGWEYGPRLKLPTGFYFGDGSESDVPDTIAFKPDGTVRDTEDYTIVIMEDIKPDDKVTVRVGRLSAFITVEYE